DAQADALQAMANLASLAAGRLWPAIEAGSVVVCRDYEDAAVVRFGALAGLTEEHMIRLAEWATGELHPGLVVLVDAGQAPAGARAGVGGASGQAGPGRRAGGRRGRPDGQGRVRVRNRRGECRAGGRGGRPAGGRRERVPRSGRLGTGTLYLGGAARPRRGDP